MKKFLFFMLLCGVALGFQACSNDDDDNSLPLTTENLIGKWVYTDEYIKIEYIIENSTNGQEYQYSYAWGEEPVSHEPFSYKINGNNIVIDYDSYTITYKVIELRSNTITLGLGDETLTLARTNTDDSEENNNNDNDEDNNGNNSEDEWVDNGANDVNPIYGSWKYEWGDPDGEYVIYHLQYDGTGYTQIMNSNLTTPEDEIQPFTFTIEGNIITATGTLFNTIEIISINKNKATLLINGEMQAEMTRI